MDNNLRLLVHAGASSTRQDDNQRVEQVAAYLDLDSSSAYRTHFIWPPDGGGGSERVQDFDLGNRAAPPDELPEGHDSTTFIDDTQLAYTFLESQLFTSPAGFTRLTSARKRPSDFHVHSTAPAPSKAARLSDTAVLPQFIQRESYSEPLSTEAEREQPLSQPKPKEKTQTSEGTVASNDTTSELPNSYSLGDVSCDIHNRPQLSERSISDPGPSPVRQGRNPAEASDVVSQRTLLRDRQQPLKIASVTTGVQHPVTHLVGPTSHLAGPVATKDLPLTVGHSPHPLSTSIEPAGPETSIEPFTTHITPTLQKLAQNPELSAVFLPIVVVRSLSVHERGHWEVQCPNWTVELQTSFWKTLESVVGTGKAGWGVRCTRGPEVPLSSQSSQQHREGAKHDATTSFGPVRVYCWGETVKHVYLLLFVASNSKVRKLGLRWYDAQGSVVYQMRTG